eukprot:146079_1
MPVIAMIEIMLAKESKFLYFAMRLQYSSIVVSSLSSTTSSIVSISRLLRIVLASCTKGDRSALGKFFILVDICPSLNASNSVSGTKCFSYVLDVSCFHDVTPGKRGNNGVGYRQIHQRMDENITGSSRNLAY